MKTLSKRGMIKMLAFCCAFGLLSFSFCFSALALASAPLTGGNTQNGMVRVYLASFGSASTVNATICGSYTMHGNQQSTLANGAKLTVKLNTATGLLTCTQNGSTTAMGQSFTLRRHEKSGENGVKFAQGRVPANLYPGDVTFTAKSGGSGYKLYVIVSVFMEDYLYGVLPYEMGDTSGLEALKAQAVAARTYTLRAMNAASSALYDVVDTTADQVYSGTPSGTPNCKTAVDATRGIVLKNGNEFTATYYSASNGGQTETVKNIWGSSAYPYMLVKDDPYDLASPDARKLSFTVRSSGTQGSTLQSLLDNKAAATFGSGAKVNGVMAVKAHSPKYPAPSRLYTKLDFTVLYTRNGKQNTGKLTFDIFSELESPLGMSINSDKNELWSVTPTSTGFTVTARRYGHGLGMSQRGAMYMAAQGYPYDQILAFYYPGCTRVQYQLTGSILGSLSGGQSAQVQVTPVAPAPIENPDTALYSARVTTASGTLNLRAAASTGASVLRTISQNAVIPVYQTEGEWCKTVYEGVSGYVMRSFLTALDASNANTTPSDAPPSVLLAQITTASGPLNCRAAAGTGAKILTAIPRMQTVTVIEKGSEWSKINYQGTEGYVMNRYLTWIGDTASSPAPVPPVSSSLSAQVITPSGTLNLCQKAGDTALILTTIPRLTVIPVLEKGVDWCKTEYDGTVGYVMTRFLNFSDAASETHSALTEETSGGQYARVTTQSGTLNLRKHPNENADILLTIPQNECVPLLSRGETWSKVVYQYTEGYVMTKFLTVLGAADEAEYPSFTPVSARVRDGIGALNLRAGASTGAGILMEIPQNACVLVTQKSDIWCAVTYLGHSGYCMRSYLEFDES